MPAVKKRRRGAFLNAGAQAQSEIQAELNRASQLCEQPPIADLHNTDASSEFTSDNNNESDQRANPDNNKPHQKTTSLHVDCMSTSEYLPHPSGSLKPDSTMTLTINSEDSLRTRALRFLKQLELEHPSLFNTHRPPPLQVGIQKSLFVLYPAVPRKVIRYAVGLHTNRLSYLRSIRPGYSRYAMDMNPGPSVTEEEAAAAKNIVISRKAKLQSSDID